MYTGLRVGLSIAQGLARALVIPAIGVGRLELDAYPHRDFDGQIVAVHRAGRGELAWASYQARPWRELSPPRIAPPEELAYALQERTLVVGELDEKLLALLEGPTAIAFLESEGDPVAVAKALGTAARTTRILAVRGGILEGRAITAEDVENLAKLPAADVLRAQVVGALAGPLTTVVGLFTAPLRDLVGVLDARIEQLKTQEPETEAAEEGES